MVEPYSRPKSFTPLVTIYVAAFYTGVVGSAITEQLYKVITFLCLLFLWFYFINIIVNFLGYFSGSRPKICLWVLVLVL